jgi:hypothetical protein
MVMQHKDGTLYSCLSGVAFQGPKKGAKLQVIPTLVSDWGFWLHRYPNNVAYEMHPRYRPVDLPASVSQYARESRAATDERLAADSSVLGVVVGDQARAYPVSALEKGNVIHDTVTGRELVVLWYGPTSTSAAYECMATAPDQKTTNDRKTRSVTLALNESTAETPFIDKETGSHWDVAGRAVDGELKGYTLNWIDSTQVKWFAWAAEHPQTTIYIK